MTPSDLTAIPTSLLVDLGHLDPVEFQPRLVALFRDERIRDRYRVNSGARGTIHQAALFAGWTLHLPGFNPANPPGTSLHEYGLKDRQFAFAVDIEIVKGKGGSWAELHAVGAEYGFCFPYAKRPKNPVDWHAELAPNLKPLPVKPPVVVTAPMSEEDDMPAYADKYTWSNGAQVQVFKNGDVRCFFGARSFGSMGNVPAEGKKVFNFETNPVAAVGPIFDEKGNPKGPQDGYVIALVSGHQFTFDFAFARSVGI